LSSANMMKPVLAGMVYGLFQGAQLLIMKAVGLSADPLVLSFSFLVVANLTLTAWISAAGHWPKIAAGWRRWPYWLIVGIFNSTLTYLTVAGVHLSGASLAGVLVRSDLIFGVLLGYLIFREEVRGGEISGGMMMLAGILCVTDISIKDLAHISIGHLYLLLAGLLLAVNALIIKYGLGMLWQPAVAWFNTATASVCLGLVLLLNGAWQGLSELAAPLALLGVLALGAKESLGLLAYYYALASFPAWIARSFSLLAPLVAIGGGWLIFGEIMTTRQIAGTILAISGMIVLHYFRSRRLFSAGGQFTKETTRNFLPSR